MYALAQALLGSCMLFLGGTESRILLLEKAALQHQALTMLKYEAVDKATTCIFNPRDPPRKRPEA